MPKQEPKKSKDDGKKPKEEPKKAHQKSQKTNKKTDDKNKKTDDKNKKTDDKSDSASISSTISSTNTSLSSNIPPSEGPVYVSPYAVLGQCSICLSRINNRAVVDPCHHEFCITCIRTWMQHNDRCPNCRIGATHILHNIRSETELDRIPVERRPQSAEGPRLIGIPLFANALLFTDLTFPGFFIRTSEDSITLLSSNHGIIVLQPNSVNYFSDLSEDSKIVVSRRMQSIGQQIIILKVLKMVFVMQSAANATNSQSNNR